MRYFWSLILVLAVVTAGLFTLRVTRERAALTPVAAAPSSSAGGMAEGGLGQRPARPAAEPAPAPPPAAPMEGVIDVPETSPALADDEQIQPVPSVTAHEAGSAEAIPEIPAATTPPASQFSLDALLGAVAEAAERVEAVVETPPAAVAEPAPAIVSDPMMEAAIGANAAASEAPASTASVPVLPGVVGPAFEVRADGSLSVEGVGVVPGSGTVQRPFVLDWEVLRSVQREFNPRQGKSEVPGWLKQLDGKRVRIEGNTLLPVVAQTTTELLVMQNPWDGCCLGVPPTPYDAIEVKLSNAQRMGNSPTSFGQVEGVFKVDPYIVSGWLLGLYMVEDAVFEAAAGIVLPEI